MKSGLLLRRIRVNSARGGERSKNLPFLSRGPVEIELRSPLTLLVGENGSGKTTLLEAVAANCAIRPGGGRSYTETEDEREDTAISAAVEVSFGGRRPKGLFLRADRFAETMARAGRLPMPATGEWRLLDEQSRGEGLLSLLTARVDASETMLFILDEPETGLSPRRQMALLFLLDQLFRAGRSQALVATHSPILMSHPGCDLLWIDGAGITRRKDADHGAPHAITESLGAVYVDNSSDIILVAVSDGVMSCEVLAGRHKCLRFVAHETGRGLDRLLEHLAGLDF